MYRTGKQTWGSKKLCSWFRMEVGSELKVLCNTLKKKIIILKTAKTQFHDIRSVGSYLSSFNPVYFILPSFKDRYELIYVFHLV